MNLFGQTIGVGASILIVMLILCIAPMILLWAGNSLAMAGGSTFYIEHTFLNYIYTFFFIAILRGGK